jgi:hypothetical protein
MGLELADGGEPRHEREAAIVLPVDRLRFAQRLVDHFSKLLHPGAVDLGEVDVLRVRSRYAGDLARQRVKVGVGIVAIAFYRRACARQIALERMMHDEAEFLLRDVGLAPDLAFFGQEHAANERCQLFVACRHLLQRRI